MTKPKLQLLSVGFNKKLAKNIAVFNLPQGITCPGKTAACAKLCYACKAERCYKSAREKRAKNYQIVKDLLAQGPGVLAVALHAEIKASGATKVRIHESGDAFSQDYLNEWIVVATMNPNVTFLMYTKSFHLDFSAAPDNMKIYCSTDSTSPSGGNFITMAAMLTKYPRAHLVQKGETPLPGTVTCAGATDKHYCGASCMICWTGKDNVYFDQH